PKLNELIYIDPSPDYCAKNKKYRITGVAGRRCHLYAKAGEISCEEMCCDYGYHITKSTQSVKCNCQFN
ncbi:uncharacterized protein TRIADDRAFT_8072, partial [Trichoplax adhaerens]